MKYIKDLVNVLKEVEKIQNSLLTSDLQINETFAQFFKKEIVLEDKKEPIISFNILEKGHELLMLNTKDDNYYRIVISHIYSTVVFYKWLEGPDKGKEEYVDKSSYSFRLDIYPMIVKVPKGWAVKSLCNKVELQYE